MDQTFGLRLRGRAAAVGVAVCVSGTGIVAPGQVAAAGPPNASSHGAGMNKPANNDGSIVYKSRCVGSSTNFKITQATIKMWSTGDRIKGFHFKYRLVAAGTEGQPQWWSNWSKPVKASFKANRVTSLLMTAPGLGQSFSSTAAWEAEVKLKYPRSLRPAKRYKYRLPVTTPQCGFVPNELEA